MQWVDCQGPGLEVSLGRLSLSLWAGDELRLFPRCLQTIQEALLAFLFAKQTQICFQISLKDHLGPLFLSYCNSFVSVASYVNPILAGSEARLSCDRNSSCSLIVSYLLVYSSGCANVLWAE